MTDRERKDKEVIDNIFRMNEEQLDKFIRLCIEAFPDKCEPFKSLIGDDVVVV